MPKRNWVAITQLQDDRTRVAVSLATDPEILAYYAHGFPHLFTEGDDEGPLHIPLSALMQAAFEHSQKEYPDPKPSNLWELDSNFSLSAAVEVNPALNIPSAYEWHCEGSVEVAPRVPEEIMQQFVGQKSQAGIVIVYRGKKYLVCTINFHGNEYPEIGSFFKHPPELDTL
ncbi:MAG: hypothetical protein HOG08_02155, partial [Candidatus Magasanikbacteria bacterium]|nr:hypothetical protein [Candidatus Magasanikbacteria bacterium]